LPPGQFRASRCCGCIHRGSTAEMRPDVAAPCTIRRALSRNRGKKRHPCARCNVSHEISRGSVRCRWLFAPGEYGVGPACARPACAGRSCAPESSRAQTQLPRTAPAVNVSLPTTDR
jgi:hypothetical protein